jgi:hypothetical protein
MADFFRKQPFAIWLWPGSFIFVGGWMALAGHHSLLMQNQRRLNAKLIELVRAGLSRSEPWRELPPSPFVLAPLPRLRAAVVTGAGLVLAAWVYFRYWDLSRGSVDLLAGFGWPVPARGGPGLYLDLVGHTLPVVLFAVGGYLALAGHRGLLYQSNNRIAARLAGLIRQHPPRPPEHTP